MNLNTNQNTSRKKFSKKKIAGIILTAAILIITIASLQTQSMRKFYKIYKSFFSDYTGGLNRTVTVYDGNGNVIKTWSGKVDVEENDYGNKVLFDINGKRKAVYNAPVIIEEE